MAPSEKQLVLSPRCLKTTAFRYNWIVKYFLGQEEGRIQVQYEGHFCDCCDTLEQAIKSNVGFQKREPLSSGNFIHSANWVPPVCWALEYRNFWKHRGKEIK